MKLLLVLMAVAACGGPMVEVDSVMKASDALALPRPEPDHRLAYGRGDLQFGELRVPEGEGPHPVVIVIHGGCWLAEYDLGHISSLADALAAVGLATWSIEYRRVGDAGGGWPGTFQDVANAADYLPEIAGEYGLDLDRVAAVGHSAGGHLALWLAGRTRLESDDPLRGEAPLPLNGVVSLAGIPDLAAFSAPLGCGSAVPMLLDGEGPAAAGRLHRASPIEMLPFGIPVMMVTGGRDAIVPASQAREFAEKARRMGDEVTVVEIAEAGHFELIDPRHPSFEEVRSATVRAVQSP